MKVPPSLAFAIIGVLLLGITGVGYLQYKQAVEPSESSAVSDSLAFHTEEEWTALQIGQFLADFGALSKNERAKLQTVAIKKLATSGTAGAYEFKMQREKGKISLENGVWNPVTYAAWAREVLPVRDAQEPPVSSIDCAKILLDPGFAVFSSENKRISEFLNAHPASSQGHLQAALLVGTIALNDYSGLFCDTRIPLNRMTAHLAAADALGLPASDPARQLAESIRLTLCGQQSDALAVISSWPANVLPDEWSAILRLRNTGDWREGRAAAQAGGPALQNEYFRALVNSIDASDGLDFLKEAKVKANPLCWRIANEVSLSVSNGHIFTQPIVGIDLKEIAGAAEEYGVKLSKDNFLWLNEYLDTPEGSPVSVGAGKSEIQVAGRNLFAGYHQRQFMQGGQKLFGFLRDDWGVADPAEKLEGFLTEKIPNLRYKPFLLRMNARKDSDRQAANVPCEEIIRDHPEIVTACLWASLRKNQNNKNILSGPDFHAWFHPEVPQGTAFDIERRLFDIGVGDENDDKWLAVLYNRAPYSYSLALFNAYLANNRSYKNMSGEIALKWFSSQVDYRIKAMNDLADCYEGQPELYEKTMRKAAAFDPDINIDIADYFRILKMDDKAAEYYLLAFESANNRVQMANAGLWLVKYLFFKNDRALALKVAEAAKEVYSYLGLRSYEWLMQAEGQWDKALETARKIYPIVYETARKCTLTPSFPQFPPRLILPVRGPDTWKVQLPEVTSTGLTCAGELKCY